MIDQKKLLGGATAIAGVAALFYANWEHVSLVTVLILLFGLSCLAGFLAESICFRFAVALTGGVVTSRWWVHGGFGTEADWRHSFAFLVLLSGFIAAAGAQLGRLVRRILERQGEPV